MKIGIIGAGVAGLTCAYELSKFGFDITVFEATDRIGGRIFTYYFDDDKKLYGELGAMRFPASHKYTMHYINAFNLEIEPFPMYSPETFTYVKGVRVKNDEAGLNVSEYIYPLFAMDEWERETKWFDLLDYIGDYPIFTMPEGIRNELVDIKKTYSPYINYWDCVNTRKAMRVLGLSNGAIDMLSSINPTVFPFWYDSHYEILNQFYTGAFENLYRIKGGFSRLPLAFYEEIKDRVKFRFSTPITALYNGRDRKQVILKSKKDENSGEISDEFDYVICTIPFTSLRNVDVYPSFSSIKHQAIREVNYTESQKTLFLCKRRFWQDQGIDGGGSVTDLPVASMWYPTYGDVNEPSVFLASYNINKDARRLGSQPIGRRVELVKRQVEMVHGIPVNSLDDIVDDFASISWGDMPYSLGCFAYFQPEQKRLFSYAMTTPEFEGKVLFAGEHVSAFHGWLNGAFETGLKASIQILDNVYC